MNILKFSYILINIYDPTKTKRLDLDYDKFPELKYISKYNLFIETLMINLLEYNGYEICPKDEWSDNFIKYIEIVYNSERCVIFYNHYANNRLEICHCYKTFKFEFTDGDEYIYRYSNDIGPINIIDINNKYINWVKMSLSLIHQCVIYINTNLLKNNNLMMFNRDIRKIFKMLRK